MADYGVDLTAWRDARRRIKTDDDVPEYRGPLGWANHVPPAWRLAVAYLPGILLWTLIETLGVTFAYTGALRAGLTLLASNMLLVLPVCWLPLGCRVRRRRRRMGGVGLERWLADRYGLDALSVEPYDTTGDGVPVDGVYKCSYWRREPDGGVVLTVGWMHVDGLRVRLTDGDGTRLQPND